MGSCIRCSYGEVGPDVPALQMFWKNTDQSFSEERSRNLAAERGPQEQTATLWIADTIDQFRVDPHNGPCVFRIAEITLLVPED